MTVHRRLHLVPSAAVWVFVVCTGLIVPAVVAADFYISPKGTPTGTGAIADPWDIATGLRKFTVVMAGDTVWLRGGTYGTGGPLVLTCTLQGTASAPVIVRQYRGEHAKVDAAIKLNGPYVWLWGFEVTNSNPQREVKNIDTERPRGVLIAATAAGAKIINMVIHDVGRAGIGGGTNNFEVYGTLLWGNGLYDRQGHRGDATYLNLWHASPDPKAVNSLRDNIAFRNLYAGFKLYTEWPDVFVEGFDLEGNVSFDNGARSSEVLAQGNFLVRSELSGPPIKRLKVISNYSYRSSDSTNPYNAEFGCKPGSGIECEDAIIRDNYFVSGTTAIGTLRVQNWKNVQVLDNTIIGNQNATLATWISDFPASSVVWDGNHYHRGSATPFKLAGLTHPRTRPEANDASERSKTQAYKFPVWRTAASVDEHGTHAPSQPTGVKAVVRKNVYEPGERAHIIVYNWDLKDSVTVDLSSAGIVEGTHFEIMDAQNYFGPPVVTAVFHAASPTVAIPMKLTAVTPLVGNVSHISNQHTAPEFAVFVLRKSFSGR